VIGLAYQCAVESTQAPALYLYSRNRVVDNYRLEDCGVLETHDENSCFVLNSSHFLLRSAIDSVQSTVVLKHDLPSLLYPYVCVSAIDGTISNAGTMQRIGYLRELAEASGQISLLFSSDVRLVRRPFSRCMLLLHL
jgi:hypothetical protein